MDNKYKLCTINYDKVIAAKSPAPIVIGGELIQAKLAITTPERTKGLGGIKDIELDEGMLFCFNDLKIRHFWMEGILFNELGIIFLDENGIVINMCVMINDEMSSSYHSTSERSAQYVLEVHSNIIKELKQKITKHSKSFIKFLTTLYILNNYEENESDKLDFLLPDENINVPKLVSGREGFFKVKNNGADEPDKTVDPIKFVTDEVQDVEVPDLIDSTQENFPHTAVGIILGIAIIVIACISLL